MEHAVRVPNPPHPLPGNQLVVHQVPAWQDNLVWLIAHPATGQAAVVDGPDASVVPAAEALGLTLTTILNTHTHPDHVGINHALGPKLDSMRVIGPASRASDIPGLTDPVEDGDRFELFGAPVEALLTEGHLDGHTSYWLSEHQAVFVGDTMFGAGCGYLFDGPPSKMHHSLQRLLSLGDDTLVFCAHEYTQDNLRFAWSLEPNNPALEQRIRDTWELRSTGRSTIPTTIGLERSTNPFVRSGQPAITERLKLAFPSLALSTPEERFAATRKLKDAKLYRGIRDEQLPLPRRAEPS